MVSNVSVKFRCSMATFRVPFGADGQRRLWVAGGWVAWATFGAWNADSSIAIDSGFLRGSVSTERQEIMYMFLPWRVSVARTSRAEVSPGADSLGRNNHACRSEQQKNLRTEVRRNFRLNKKSFSFPPKLSRPKAVTLPRAVLSTASTQHILLILLEMVQA